MTPKKEEIMKEVIAYSAKEEEKVAP